MRYIAIIKSCYPSLSKAEKKVADYILKEKGKIIYQTETHGHTMSPFPLNYVPYG